MCCSRRSILCVVNDDNNNNNSNIEVDGQSTSSNVRLCLDLSLACRRVVVGNFVR